MKQRLERYFEFEQLSTGWRIEILAGFTTFITMAYIVFVNPAILSETGMPLPAVVAATCLSAAVGSILMGVLARYPIALAPGMGLNAYFTYTVCKGMGVPWQTALGAVFISGVVFLILTLAGVRQLIVKAIPADLYGAVAVGIGLFIALIGLKNSGLIVAHPATLLTLGDLHQPSTLLAIFGLLLTSALLAWRVRAAMLIGVLATTALGALTGQVQWNPKFYSLSEITATSFRLDIPGALKIGALEIIFVFLFVDMFDNIGTLVAVSKKAGLYNPKTNEIPRMDRILLADSVATITGSLAGTSTVVSYIESAAGVVAGGRTGVTSIVTGLLFLLALVIAPVIGVIPAAATAPALIIVGSLMASHAAEIQWDDPGLAIPAFLTMITIPLTFSIANGLAFGLTSYTLIKLCRGRFREFTWMELVLAGLFITRFVYLARA
ncbi:MAG TPA: NCS2 family permease [Bryobacteraceae bacterium]|jgi:AGZA family xanthine/uracil permease-like MFS transporter